MLGKVRFLGIVLLILSLSLFWVDRRGILAQSITDEWGVIQIKPGESLELAYVGWPEASAGLDMAVQDVSIGVPVSSSTYHHDRCEDLGEAFVLAERLVSSPRLVGVIGNQCTDAARWAAQVYARQHVPFLSVATGDTALTEEGYLVVNDLFPSLLDVGRRAAEYTRHIVGLESVGVVCSESLQEEAGAFIERFMELGGQGCRDVGVSLLYRCCFLRYHLK